MTAPANEHEVKSTFEVDFFYINEAEPRTASPIFAHMKREADKADARCAISGQPHPQYHHFFVEYAAHDEIDWITFKGVAIGDITVLPVLDQDTDAPTDETFDARLSWMWLVARITEMRTGMDWRAFDPAQPLTFVDSVHNMLPLSAKFHIHRGHGIHLCPFPEWNLRGMPLKKNFILTPDEDSKV